MTTCTTCGRSDASPYRVYDDRGKVVQGCIDACHTGRIVTPSESAYWHNRPAAKAVRASVRKARRMIGGAK